jgi:hypothetical protein
MPALRECRQRFPQRMAIKTPEPYVKQGNLQLLLTGRIRLPMELWA